MFQLRCRMVDEEVGPATAYAEPQIKGASVLFLTADGGQIACAGVHACSYMAGQPAAGKPLPRIVASE